MMQIDMQATALSCARYERLSRFYDRIEGMAEARYRPWREKLWALAACAPHSGVEEPRVLDAELRRVLARAKICPTGPKAYRPLHRPQGQV